MEDDFDWMTIGAALLHPYSLCAVIVESYNIFVLNIYGNWDWYHTLVMSLYSLLMAGNIAQLVHGRNYLFGKPARRFSSDASGLEEEK